VEPTQLGGLYCGLKLKAAIANKSGTNPSIVKKSVEFFLQAKKFPDHG
jgi:hypothetical protein